jgi:hypothetical protein
MYDNKLAYKLSIYRSKSFCTASCTSQWPTAWVIILRHHFFAWLITSLIRKSIASSPSLTIFIQGLIEPLLSLRRSSCWLLNYFFRRRDWLLLLNAIVILVVRIHFQLSISHRSKVVSHLYIFCNWWVISSLSISLRFIDSLWLFLKVRWLIVLFFSASCFSCFSCLSYFSCLLSLS